MMRYEKSLVWFRRDLCDFDHAALYHALKSSKQVFCVFVFDTEILDLLKNKADRRVEFIWESVRELKAALQKNGGDLIVQHGIASEIIPNIALQANAHAVYSNADYEPLAIERDKKVATALAKHGIAFHQFKDQVIFEKDEVLSLSGKPYSVFTPYKNAHLKKLSEDLAGFYLKPYPVDSYIHNLAKLEAKVASTDLISLESMGFARTNLSEMRLPTGMRGGA